MAQAGRVPHPELRELLFADLPPAAARERFVAIDALRELATAAELGDAAAVRSRLGAVLADPGAEARTRLQAWTLARAGGVEPPEATAHVARGVVVDMGLDEGTDTLAGYEDGSARYFNFTGAAVVWDIAGDAEVGEAIRGLLAAGQAVADGTGVLEGTRPPAPGAGGAAIWVLTDAGVHLGVGPAGPLQSDRLGGPLIAAAVRLMQLLMGRSQAAR